MADEITPAPEAPVSIVETPEPTPAPTLEEKLYAKTPNGEAPPAPEKTDAPAPVITDPKAPAEPEKEPAKPATPPVPTDYTLALPENSPLTKEDLDARAKSAKERGLTKDQAEAELKTENDVAVRTMARFQEKQTADTKAAQTLWVETIKADPELGGDRYNQTVVEASRAFKATASPELQKIIRDSGLGNHPEYVRQMAKFGRMMGEDTMIAGRSGGVAVQKTTAQKMYGATTPGADGKLPGA